MWNFILHGRRVYGLALARALHPTWLSYSLASLKVFLPLHLWTYCTFLNTSGSLEAAAAATQFQDSQEKRLPCPGALEDFFFFFCREVDFPSVSSVLMRIKWRWYTQKCPVRQKDATSCISNIPSGTSFPIPKNRSSFSEGLLVVSGSFISLPWFLSHCNKNLEEQTKRF